MLNDNVLDNEKAERAFEQWLEHGMPSNEAGDVFSDSAQQHSEQNLWQQRFNTANEFNYQAKNYVCEKVPTWDRSAAFPQKTPWWHWQGIPVVSMVFSICTLLLVVYKVEFSMSPQGVLISFANDEYQQQQIAKVVDEKIADFNKNQQVTLARYSADFIQQQQQSNLQLASYILSTSRQERKEDFSDFVRFINEQRKDEAQQQRIKFQQLEDAILYQSSFNQQAKTGTQSTNWIVE